MFWLTQAMVVLLTLFGLAGCDGSTQVNTEALDVNQQTINFPAKDGKWTIVNYWADWCPPCREEIPELNAFAHNQSDKARVVGINADLLAGNDLKESIKELGIEYTVVQSDPINILDTSLEGLPTTYLISPDGKLHGPLLGAVTEEELIDEMKAYG